MSLECPRRIDYLAYQCKNLGIEVKPAGKKLMKDDYVKALRNYFIIQKYGSLNNIPWSLQFMLSIECPQLCRRIKDLKPEQQELVWESQDWIAEEKIDGCFTYNTPIMLEDGTTLPIGKIVEERLNVNVLSLNTSTGKIEPKPVINWFNNGYKQMNEWCHLSRNKNQQRVLGTENIQNRFVTKNHKVWDGFNWVEAANCNEAYGISYWLNDIQKQVLYGMLLGDSTFVKDTRRGESYRVTFFHSEKQKDYFDKKTNLFNKFTTKVVNYISGYGKLCYKTGFSNPYLHYVYNIIGNRKNNISYEFLNSITPLTLAIWYLDDGSREKGFDEINTTNKYSRANFSVFRYDENVVDLLINKLNEFGYQASKRFAKRDNGFLICLNSEGSQKFFNDIAKYIPSSMSYKLPNNFRHLCDTFKWWNMNDIEYNPVKVKTNVSKTTSTSCKKLCAYDIEVADNHNYIANGFIVHNCRMLILWDCYEEKFHFYSRNNSVTDYLPQDYSDTILVTAKDFYYPYCFVLDCEVISSNSEVETNIQCLTQLQSTAALLNLNAEDSKKIQQKYPLKFIVFDCLHDEIDYINQPWIERHRHAEKLASLLKESGFNCELNKVVENTEDNKFAKREYFEKLIADNKEGCFTGDCRVMMADLTQKRIKDIVIGDKVLSYDHVNNKVIESVVTNVFRNGKLKGSEWVTVYPETIVRCVGGRCNERFDLNTFHRIVATQNHKFYNGTEYTPITKCKNIYKLNYYLDDYREKALHGWLLSDGMIDDNNLISVTQKLGDYFNFTEELFSKFKNKSKVRISGKGSNIGFFSIRHDVTKHITKKDFNSLLVRKWLSEMDPITFAYMFMGDGNGSNNNISLAMCSYSLEEVNLLVKRLNNIGINNIRISIDKRAKSGSGASLVFKKSESQKLINWFGMYVHQSMRYKLRSFDCPDYIEPPTLVPTIKCQTVEVTNCINNKNLLDVGLTRYDIEVDNAHNYFIEGVLVHNCVLKNRNAKYHATSSRTIDCVKVKRTTSDNEASDIDAFVTDYVIGKDDTRNENMVVGFVFSVKMEKDDGTIVTHPIATCSNVSDFIKEDATVIDADGSVKLNPTYYGKVATIQGQNISARNLRITHAVINCWRPEKDINGCEILKESFIRSMIF